MASSVGPIAVRNLELRHKMFLAQAASQAWSAFTGLLFSGSIMEEVPSPLPLIFSSPRREFDTEMFLSILWNDAIQQSSDPTSALKRFRITSMKFRKTKDVPSEHEFLVSEVLTGMDEEPDYQFILERTVKIVDSTHPTHPDDAAINTFLNHEDSKKLLDTVLNTITSPQSLAVATAVAAAPALGSASILLPLAGIVAASSSSSSSQFSEIPTAPLSSPLIPEYPLFDQASMAMAKILQEVSETKVGSYISKSLNASKPPKNTQADDLFMGSARLDTNEYYLGKQIGQFKPESLTLFHLALLAHIVHSEYPLYSLFMSQCYWFSSTVFYAAQIIDRDLSLNLAPQASPSLPDLPDLEKQDEKNQDHIFLPFHLYMPEEAGRWRGLRISGCKLVVLSTIVRKFYTSLNDYMVKVCCDTFSEL